MHRAQAFDTMKLLIAAVVAVAILTILGTILARITPMTMCDPLTDVTQKIKEVSNSPGVTRNIDNCMLPRDDIITGRAYKSGAVLTTQNLVVVCGAGMEVGCTNGIYPTTTDTSVLQEMGQDPDIVEYWGGAGTYANQQGQVGPTAVDTPVTFSITCGETYCRLTINAG